VVQYLELGDYLLIAERVLHVPARILAGLDRIDLADSAINAPAAGFAGTEAYPEFETKVAVLGWHLVKNHPLPDGNKRCAFLSMVEFVERNGRTWTRSANDPDETDRIIRSVAAGSLRQEELRDWVAQRIS
jgi:death-on-curing protein